MSDPTGLPTTPLIGLPVCTKEDEDYMVGVVEDIESETGNLIIRGNLDLRKYSVPRNTVVNIDQSTNKLVLDMTRDDFIEYER
jgi:hypothetical protein